MHLILLFAAVWAIPIQLVCPNPCQSLYQNETTEFLLTYSNSKSLVAPFPYISQIELTAFDYRNTTRRSSQSYDWARGTPSLTIPFRPDEYIQNTDSIGIQLRWTELNHDRTLAGIGSEVMLYIDIKGSKDQPTSTTSGRSTTIIIGSNSFSISAIPNRFLALLGLFLLWV